jgi:hypothetical protein
VKKRIVEWFSFLGIVAAAMTLVSCLGWTAGAPALDPPKIHVDFSSKGLVMSLELPQNDRGATMFYSFTSPDEGTVYTEPVLVQGDRVFAWAENNGKRSSIATTELMSGGTIGPAAQEATSAQEGEAEKVTTADGAFTFYIPDYEKHQSGNLISPEQTEVNKKLIALMESQVRNRPVSVVFPMPMRGSLLKWMQATYRVFESSFVEGNQGDTFYLDETEDNDFVIDVKNSTKATASQLEIIVMTYEYWMAADKVGSKWIHVDKLR